jgi:hypothetical protein
MSGLDFSTVIAFLLPGFVGVYALSYVSPRIADLFEALLSKDSSTGASLLLVFASLAAGVLIGGVRNLVLDQLQFATGVERRKLRYASLANPDVLTAFKEAIAATYRFAQFYGNMAVALGLFIALKTWRSASSPRNHIPLLALGLLAFAVMVVRHRQSLAETYARLGDILGQGPSKEAERGCKEAGKEDKKDRQKVQKDGTLGGAYDGEEGEKAGDEEGEDS